ncbi:MAG: DUF6489 family protein [Pseudomonadota bacterium]
MKVEVHIECTPDEARQFLGLPDVTELQKQMVDTLYGRMGENIKTMDSSDLMGTWGPMMMQGWGDAQKSFWQIMQSAAGDTSKSTKGKSAKG